MANPERGGEKGENEESGTGPSRLAGWVWALPVDFKGSGIRGSRAPTRMTVLGEGELLESPRAASAFRRLWRDPLASWGGGGRFGLRGGSLWIGPERSVERVRAEAIEIMKDWGKLSQERVREEWLLQEGLWTPREKERGLLGERRIWMALSEFDFGQGRVGLASHLSAAMCAEPEFQKSRGGELLGSTTKARFGGVGTSVFESAQDCLIGEAERETRALDRGELEGEGEEGGQFAACRALTDFESAFGLDFDALYPDSPPFLRARTAEVAARALAIGVRKALGGAVGEAQAVVAPIKRGARL